LPVAARPLVVLVVALAALALGKTEAAAGPDPVRAALRAAEATGSIDPARTQAYRSTYHVLNRDLPRALCRRTGERAICHAWHSFTAEVERRCPRVVHRNRALPFRRGRSSVVP
jgi:hypothetical protein